MTNFEGKIAVITGGGTGMGRELAIRLARAGSHLALCDVVLENLAETKRLCEEAAPAGTRVTTHECDVSDKEAVFAFRDAVLAEHETTSLNLLFNNAGIGGPGSFINDDVDEWERTFNICWGGVYLITRAFLPSIVASEQGYVVNTSSINGFWASLGPNIGHTSYSAAKFAVKGFTEALHTDLALNAPHVKAAVVMPGHIGTSIAMNSRRILGHGTAEQMTTEELQQVREQLARMGLEADGIGDADLRAFMHQRMLDFQDKAPTTASSAADIILDGIRAGKWRILVGEDAVVLDRMVREDPEGAYTQEFLDRIHAVGHLVELVPSLPGETQDS